MGPRDHLCKGKSTREGSLVFCFGAMGFDSVSSRRWIFWIPPQPRDLWKHGCGAFSDFMVPLTIVAELGSHHLPRRSGSRAGLGRDLCVPPVAPRPHVAAGRDGRCLFGAFAALEVDMDHRLRALASHLVFMDGIKLAKQSR